MDGHTLLRNVREILQESSSGTFMNERTTYDYLYEAATKFNLRTHLITSSQSITVSQGTTDYNLNVDYIEILPKLSNGRGGLKFTVNSVDYFLFPVVQSDSIFGNITSQSTIPDGYYVKNASLSSNITGTATSTNIKSNGESTLTDTSASFSTVSAGDIIHNTTDGSHGVVVSVTNSTNIVCGMFDGTTNQFTSGDAYIITPQARYKIVLYPPPLQSASMTVNYVQRPTPVYSPYKSYPFPHEYSNALAKYAAALYKFRDRDPAQGQYLMGAFDAQVREASAEMRRSLPERKNFRVDFMGTFTRSRPRGPYGG